MQTVQVSLAASTHVRRPPGRVSGQQTGARNGRAQVHRSRPSRDHAKGCEARPAVDASRRCRSSWERLKGRGNRASGWQDISGRRRAPAYVAQACLDRVNSSPQGSPPDTSTLPKPPSAIGRATGGYDPPARTRGGATTCGLTCSKPIGGRVAARSLTRRVDQCHTSCQ